MSEGFGPQMSCLAAAQEQRCPRDHVPATVIPLWGGYRGCLSSGVSLTLTSFSSPKDQWLRQTLKSFPLKLLKLSSIAKRKDLLTVRILLANLGGFMILGGNQFEL